ncbi:hypothetical protein [Amycolatopsis kentuckyensis]|uniref:hypothetical protein n=1 Tax=Amycolatopsis kentuckyensis TaxID=218823 RepID=UPI003565B9C7
MNPVLIGGLATAVVSLTGIWISRVTNRQAERRLRQDHADEVSRLKLDAAMRAGELFSTKENAPADPAAIASGLLALTKLDNAELAVALLVNLWSGGPEPRVAHETAVLVVDAALKSTGNAQLVAAELLCRNAHRLNPCQSLHWPSSIDGGWNPGFGPKTKLLLIDALIRLTLAHESCEDALRSVAVRLYGVWRGDETPRVRGCVGRLIGAVVPALRRLGYTDFMQGSQTVHLSELEAAAASGTKNPDGYLDRLVDESCKKLHAWARVCEHPDSSGCLANAV